jgi:hypothetical protein
VAKRAMSPIGTSRPSLHCRDGLAFAGKVAEVENVGFYHGGDALYILKGIPGIWHERCLRPDDATKA